MLKKNKQINIKKIIQEVLEETVDKKINKFRQLYTFWPPRGPEDLLY